MALIHCRECGKEISDTAKMCPHCGYRYKKTNGPAHKVLFGLVTVILLGGLFCLYYFFSPVTFQWCCRHNIIPATCTESETCSRCGKTFGKALGHDWIDATCEHPKMCSRCDETKGEPLEHTWVWDGGNSRICSYCGYSDGLYYCPDYEVYEYSDGSKIYEGKMGTTMNTAWFDFVVNSAYCTDSLPGYKPEKGNVIVVVTITIKNTFVESIPMFDTDFQLQWGDDADDAYAFPVTGNEQILENQLPEEYEIKVNGSKTGVLIFEAPQGYKDFSLSFLEFYEDNTEGNLFFVYFTPDFK